MAAVLRQQQGSLQVWLIYHSDIQVTYNIHLLSNGIFNSCSAERRPGTVRGLKGGSVSVSGNGSNVQLQQSISWQPPVSGNVSMFLVRYGMGVSKVQDASFNVTTRNTSIVLRLSVPVEPQDMVVYNIWVAVVTKSEERGNATNLTIQYSSELQLVTIPVTTVVSRFTLFILNPLPLSRSS